MIDNPLAPTQMHLVIVHLAARLMIIMRLRYQHVTLIIMEMRLDHRLPRLQYY